MSDQLPWLDAPANPLVFEAPAWTLRAACRGVASGGVDPWFPCSLDEGFRQHSGSAEFRELTAAAKAVCAQCPVRLECLEAGLTEFFGIWGGLTRNERKDFVRDRERGQGRLL